ncbi:MAG: long-chain fatty acid--CoA ligase, partial [Syntrophobacterales bacterium]
AMGHRARQGWVTATYREMLARIRTAARALIDMGIVPGDTVAIYSLNRPEWALVDFAILSVGAVSVPIHATGTAGQLAYILRDANVKAVFTDDRERCSCVAGIDGFQGRIVVFDADAAIDSPRICRFDDLDPSADEGVVDERLRGGRGGDLATVIYTSGTTGEPKGVMLTHHNFAHQIRAVDAAFSLGAEDRSLCFLPLSHVYERAWSYYVFYRGARNYYQSNPREVLASLREVRPTAMVSVPRLYEKVYSAVQERLETAPPLRRRLFHWALSIGAVYEDARRRGAPAPWLRFGMPRPTGWYWPRSEA